MKFYRENQINPAASCLPMLLQLPVFIALYYALKRFESNFHPAHADLSFLHFIPSSPTTTTSHWGGYVLLVVYVASQMASTYFMSTTADKMQRDALHGHAALLRLRHRALPGRASSSTGSRRTCGRSGQGLITRRLVAEDARRRHPSDAARERRRSRTTAPASQGDGSPASPGAARPQRSSRARFGARRRHEPEMSELADLTPRRPGRRSARRSGRRCASSSGGIPGSTRPRCSSRSSPKASAGSSASATSRPAWSRICRPRPRRRWPQPSPRPRRRPGRRGAGARGADRRRARRRRGSSSRATSRRRSS